MSTASPEQIFHEVLEIIYIPIIVTIICLCLGALVLLMFAANRLSRKRENKDLVAVTPDEIIDLYTDKDILEDECPDVPFSETLIKRPDPTMQLVFKNLAICSADCMSVRLKLEFLDYSEWERMHYINNLINELGITLNCGEFLLFIHKIVINDMSHLVLKKAVLGIKMLIVAYETSGMTELAVKVRKFGAKIAENIIEKKEESMEAANFQLSQCVGYQLAQFCDEEDYKTIMMSMVEKEMNLPPPARKVIWGTAARNGEAEKILDIFYKELDKPTVDEDQQLGKKLGHLHYALASSGYYSSLNFVSPKTTWEDLLSSYEALSEAYTTLHEDARKYFSSADSPWQAAIAAFTSDPITLKRAELHFMGLLFRLPYLGFEDELIELVEKDTFKLTHKTIIISKIKHHKIIFEKIVQEAEDVANALNEIIPN